MKVTGKKSGNFARTYAGMMKTLSQNLHTLHIGFANHIGVELISEIKQRTPVDYGNLRNAWILEPVRKTGNKYIIQALNPQKYAAYIEFGYMQRPGMLLRMRMERGKLRFQEMLGYSFAYGLGEPTGKAEPDENGDYIICTRKRFIPGHFMGRQGLAVVEKRLPGYKKRLQKKIRQIFRGAKRR